MGQVEKHLKPSDEHFLKGYIRLSPSKVVIERKNYRFRNWVAELGGTYNSVRLLFFLMTVVISRKTFMNAILGELFLIKNNN